jgi:RNA polymerase sigma-70 factor (ECF subfamily)
LAEQDAAPTVDRGRFQSADEPYPGHWRRFPLVWPSPETDVVAHEVRDTIDTALAELPQRQRLVLTLRDMHGYSSAEVCEILEVSPQNQRVLLHRARAAVRARLEEYFGMPLTDGGQQR